MLVRPAALAFAIVLLATPLSFAEPLALAVVEAKQTFAPGTLQPVVDIRLDDESARAFGALTTKNLNKQLDLYVDDKVVATPIVLEPILGGRTLITSSGMTVQEARDIAARLQSGTARISVEPHD